MVKCYIVEAGLHSGGSGCRMYSSQVSIHCEFHYSFMKLKAFSLANIQPSQSSRIMILLVVKVVIYSSNFYHSVSYFFKIAIIDEIKKR